MTVTSKPQGEGTVAPAVETVTLTIDGIEVTVPKGTLVIRAAERIGIAIPRFCDHPLLDPVGMCRQCMVEVPDMGNGRGMPKPQVSCTLEAMNGMKVATQVSSPVAEKAQVGMLEFLLINHPLDCPICDKGGECPLQNQSMSHGNGVSRYEGVKRTFPKPVSISAQVLLDRERCIMCARCTRFSEQISGDPFIALVERGALQQVGQYTDEPYDSYYSGNVIQICPVGALTSADYRFQSRPFDLVSTPSSCEHCASGCALRVDHRHYQVKRRLAGDDPEVNEEWNCDVGRFAFYSNRGDDRITMPLVRNGDGVLAPASWPEAIDAAVAGLKAAGTSVGVLAGGRLTVEAAYGYQKFARAVLGSNDVDCRARGLSGEEEQFLAARVAGRTLGESVTYADLESAAKVVLVGFEPEDESPMVFLRLRKAARKGKVKVVTIAPYASRGSEKMSATLVRTLPGHEAAAIGALTDVDAGTVVLAGERLARSAGALSALAGLATRTGARLAWIPRRAGEIGAIDAGCLPSLLPGGRPVADASARVDVAAAWGVASLPATPGRDTVAQLTAAATGQLKALVIAGIEPADLDDPAGALAALDEAPFVVSIERRLSEVARRADVVFPAALLEAQTGTFHDWEHRPRLVGRVNRQSPNEMTDLRILAALADALGSDLGMRTASAALAELTELGAWDGPRTADPDVAAASPAQPADGRLVLAAHRQLIDESRHNDGSTELLITARPTLARISPTTAEQLGLSDATSVTLQGTGSAAYRLVVDPSMVDGAVWVPAHSPGLSVATALGVVSGGSVGITKDGGQ